MKQRQELHHQRTNTVSNPNLTLCKTQWVGCTSRWRCAIIINRGGYKSFLSTIQKRNCRRCKLSLDGCLRNSKRFKHQNIAECNSYLFICRRRCHGRRRCSRNCLSSLKTCVRKITTPNWYSKPGYLAEASTADPRLKK